MKVQKRFTPAPAFFDAANQARTQNQLLTFAEYTAREDAKTTPNRPYAVKKVLEDNLLGEPTSFSEASSWAAPYLVPVIENEDANFQIALPRSVKVRMLRCLLPAAM